MRVVTLLPAATEIVAALGGAGSLVGISHECDYPASVLGLPRVTTTPVDPDASGAVIDAEVRRLQAAGAPVIGVAAELLRRLAPDLLITQDLCQVCAVAEGEVRRLAAALDPAPAVVALSGRTLDGLWADIRAVARALDLEADGDELIAGLLSRLHRLGGRRIPARPRVVCIEWLDPLYLAGHWVPQLVEAAGGQDVGARAGSHSARREWSDLAALRPDLAVVALCGFGVERALAELAGLESAATLESSAALGFLRSLPVWVLDGNSYTSRSGPRVVDGAELLRSALEGREAGALVRWRSDGR
jgi:iron complex transport system substrate-binding protein